MLKKILIGSGIFILVIMILLLSVPFLFKDKIKAVITETINKNIEAVVAFDDVSLNLFKSFPQANIGIEKLSVINKVPFEGDTLVYIGQVNLRMSVLELLKGKTEAMRIQSVFTQDGVIHIRINADGIANYDIAIKKEENKKGKEDNNNGSTLALSIQNYAIANYKIQYDDATSKMQFVMDQLHHKGKGDFAASVLDLDTQTTAKISFSKADTHYMKNIPVTLDAVLGLDLEKNSYTFKQNKALINQLPLIFDGNIQLVDAGQEYNLTFKTPTSSFKNALGLIPEAYAGNLEKVQTSGDFTITGKVNGLLSDTTIPKLNIAMASNGASFKYPDLPKGIRDIVIDTKVINETGIMNDTYVDLNRLSFKIDQDVFQAQATVRNLVENPLIQANLNGVINLANLNQAYPVQLDQSLAGILKAQITTKLDMKSVETHQYQNIQNTGNLSLSQFKYTDDTHKVFNINQATVQFNTSRIRLQELDVTTGKTDLNVSGVLDNFYGFLFKKQALKGNFNLKSEQLAVNDFMTKSEPAKTETTTKDSATKTNTTTADAIKIPNFLDCTFTANINTIVYDNLDLKNASGTMIIKDETVKLENVKTDIFEGQILANGTVSTKEILPVFNMNLGMRNVAIGAAFTQLEMLKTIAPIATVISGKLNSTIQLSGKLNPKELTPDLHTLSGDMTGQLQGASIDPSQSKVLHLLDTNLKFIDFKKVNLNDQKIHLTFHNGKVDIKPFNLKLQDIMVNIGGQHGFDQSMNYNVKLDVPAKYLGTEANKILASLSPAEANKIGNVPVTATISGSFTHPKVNTDIQKAVTDLATQLVQKEKEKLIQQGTNALSNLINGGKKPADSTKPADTPKEALKNKATDALKNLLKKKK